MRGRTCSVCSSPDREAIEADLLSGAALRVVEAQYGVGRMSLQRHREQHIAQVVKGAIAAERADEELDHGRAIVAHIRDLHGRAMGILARAEEDDDRRHALGAIREARATLELMAKLMGDLDESPRVNVLIAPEWVSLRSAIVAALDPFPDARGAVMRALEAPGGNHVGS